MQLPDFLTRASEGEIRLSGHRIGLYHLVERYNEGESAEMLACQYPTLSLSLVHRVLAFYLDNLKEVDAYVADCAETMRQQQQAAIQLELNSLRSRLAGQAPLSTELQVR